jgi:hypothetical protein
MIGLAVIDSFFGQLVILLLVQTGGLGYMLSATLLFLLLRHEPALHKRLLLRDTLGDVTPRDTACVITRAFWRRLGIGNIIFPEHAVGVCLAENLQAPHLAQWMLISDERELAVIRVPKGRAGCPLDTWRAVHWPYLEILAHLTSEGRPLQIDMHAPLNQNEILIMMGSADDILAMAG